MRLRRVAIVPAVLLISPTPTLAAQQPVRVLRHAPADTARPGDVITISFDRPVAGSLERTPDPSRLVRIEPTLDVRTQWRDPTTLRIVPREPLTPGRRYRITVANDFAAMDGGRLDAPYAFTITTRGPGILASVPTLAPQYAQTIEPNGNIRLIYSAPIDSTRFSRVARLEITRSPECVAQSIRYAVHSQRPITDADDWAIRYAGGYERDSIEQQFRRVVEIRPGSRVPEQCSGAIVLPSLDPTDRAEIRYPVNTQPRFMVEALRCERDDCAAENDLHFYLTAPVQRDSLLARMRIEPRVPFTLAPSGVASAQWKIKLQVRPRTTYRVRVDSSLRDIYGRRITGARMAALNVGDRLPTVGHQLGFFAVSRAHPVIRLTHVNLDSASMVIVPIPDSLRVLILGLADDQDSVARTVARLRDSVVRRIELRAEHNVEHISEIPIPTTVLAGLGAQPHLPLLAIRILAFTRARVDTIGRTQNGTPILSSPGGTGMVPTRRVAVVQVTDLVAHAKVSDVWGSVFVTDATTGRAVSGARVTTRDSADRIVASGETDTAGVARLEPVTGRPRPKRERPASGWRYEYPNPVAETRVVEVVHGGDRLLVPLTDEPWSRLEAVGRLGGQVDRARLAHASVFTDRGIYRPGEMVYLTSILRLGALASLRLPTRGDSIRLVVKRPDPGEGTERIVRDTVLHLGAYGTAADSFKLGAALPLGWYHVDVEAFDGGWQFAGQASFTVAEYRAPEFETKVAIDSGIAFRGDVVTVRASSRYYFGAPMRGAIVRWSAMTSDSRGGVAVPGLPPGYAIGRTDVGITEPYSGSTHTSGVDTLDDDGRSTIRVPTSSAPSASPTYLSVSVAVADVNRQVIGAGQSIVLHSSSFYIAARDSGTGSWYWSENVPRAVSLLTVRPDGRRVAGVRVAVTVRRHRMKLTFGDESQSPTSTWVTDTVLRDSLRTSDTPTPYTYTPRSTGWHELIFTSVDERGRSLITSVGGYVIGREWTPWGENPLRVAMQVDDEPSDSDSVAVRFVSPFERAEAWVTLEREAVLAQRRLRVGRGESVVRLPVTQAFFPGGQVSVVLVDSGSTWAVDSVHQRIRAGYETVPVERSGRELQVDVRPAQRTHAPGDSARITVAVRDQAARPMQAQVTLWAVDEGVLALAYYGRPNPLASLYSMQATGLTFATSAASIAARRRFLPAPPGWEVSADLLEARMLSSDVQSMHGSGAYSTAAGGSALRADSPVRSNFRSTAFYIASLVTDVTGAANITVKLPDNVTTYRLMAVAVTAGDSYGSGESSMVLTKPLLARASLPRFVREGDTMLAGAVVNNNTPATLSARIAATGTGLRPTGDTTTTRSLAQGSASEVRFSWRNTARAGDTAVVRFSVSGDTYGDLVRTKVPVRAPYAPRYHVVSGVANEPATIRMMLPRDIDPVRSRLTLRVGTSPVPIIRAAYGQLEVYPYLCTEQLTSNGRVILSMLRLQRAGIVDSNVAPSASTLRARLQYVVDEIARRQSRFGSIGYWSGTTWTSAWLSAYAGELLIDARAASITVDSAVIARIVSFVRPEPDTVSGVRDDAYGTRAERQRARAWRRSQELASLHFLRRADAPDVAQEDRLVANAGDMMWEDRVWLVELLARRRDQSAARAQLTRVWRDVEIAGTRVDIPDSLLKTSGFPSHVRPVARLLHATLAIDPDHARLPALIERVVQQGRAQRQWMWNTQDYASVSEALTTLAIADRQAGPSGGIIVRSARAGASDRVLLARSAGGEGAAIALDGLLERDGDWMVLPARIESDGGRVFYVLTVDEVPLVPPTTPDARGIIVERWFERFDDARPVTDVTEGDLVRGRLRITVPADREFVAVEDLLPAGLEVVDMSLRTSTLGPFESEQSREAQRAGNRANRSASSAPWLYGSWVNGWWSPWEHTETRDDRVMYFARILWKGTYTASYVARATTAGTFVRPPAHAEEMYNPSLGGRSDGGVFTVTAKK